MALHIYPDHEKIRWKEATRSWDLTFVGYHMTSYIDKTITVYRYATRKTRISNKCGHRSMSHLPLQIVCVNFFPQKINKVKATC